MLVHLLVFFLSEPNRRHSVHRDRDYARATQILRTYFSPHILMAQCRMSSLESRHTCHRIVYGNASRSCRYRPIRSMRRLLNGTRSLPGSTWGWYRQLRWQGTLCSRHFLLPNNPPIIMIQAGSNSRSTVYYNTRSAVETLSMIVLVKVPYPSQAS